MKRFIKLSRINVVLAIILFASLSLPFPGYADPVEKEETITYEISGDSTDALAQQMRAAGPQGSWAYTKWQVNWTGDCTVTLDVTYTYPEWVDREDADQKVIDAWDEMMDALKTHETGHAENGLNAAQEVEDANCSADSQEIVAKWANQDKIYDDETNHGYTQGAHF